MIKLSRHFSRLIRVVSGSQPGVRDIIPGGA